MPNPDWFMHLGGETFGPVPTESLILLLNQNRIGFTDFVWTEGMTEWRRVYELEQFQQLLPTPPTAAIPSQSSEGAQPFSAVPATPGPGPAGARRMRRFERVPIAAKASIDGVGEFDVVDLSESGIGVRARVALFIGTDVTLRLESSELPEVLRMTGVVVQHPASASHGFGVEFTNLSAAHRSLLQAFVRSKSKAAGAPSG